MTPEQFSFAYVDRLVPGHAGLAGRLSSLGRSVDARHVQEQYRYFDVLLVTRPWCGIGLYLTVHRVFRRISILYCRELTISEFNWSAWSALTRWALYSCASLRCGVL